MRTPQTSWQREHDIALVAVAVAYGTDYELDPNELALITDILPKWRDQMQPDEAQDVVMEAVEAFVAVDADARLERSIASLAETLSLDERLRAMDDMVRIAEEDGVLLSSESELIGQLAARWGVRTAAAGLLRDSQAASAPEWSLLHDIDVVYLELGGEAPATATRMDAMVRCLRGWKPDLTTGSGAAVIGVASEIRSRGPKHKLLHGAVAEIQRKISAMHRLLLLDDLFQISRSVGPTTQQEVDYINALSHLWGICFQCDAQVSFDGHST